MPSAVLEPVIPAIERPPTYALGRISIGIGQGKLIAYGTAEIFDSCFFSTCPQFHNTVF
jgi:hypothetical protein